MDRGSGFNGGSLEQRSSDKEASQTRDYCVAKNATHRAVAQILRCAKDAFSG